MRIDRIKTNIEKLSTNQKKELISFIRSSYSIFDDHTKVEGCPRCGSTHIVKNGSRNSITRYLCRDCNKSFTYKSTTILKGIHKLNKWNAFVEDFITLNISTLDEITKKLDINKQTAINWRHKLLAALVSKENKFENETIEFDEANFLISRKGRQNLGITNHSTYRKWREGQVGDSDYNVKMFFTFGRENNHIELYTSHMGRTSASDLENYFIPSKFKNITAFTDRHRSYRAFFRNHSIPQQTFLSTDHVNPNDRSVHNQTVNAYTRDFKDFVNMHLKGVSTKYIGLYAKWYEFIVNAKKAIQTKISETNPVKFNIIDEICSYVVKDFNGLEFYRQSEISFIRFLKTNGRTNWGDCKTHYYSKISA